MTERTRTIAGIAFQAIRQHNPCPHWRIELADTGEKLQCYSKAKSLAYIWDYIERDVRAVGQERFYREFTT